MTRTQMQQAIVEWARMGEELPAIIKRAGRLLKDDAALRLELAEAWVFKAATDATAVHVKAHGLSSRAMARRGQQPLTLTFFPAPEGYERHERRIHSRTGIAARHALDLQVMAFVTSWRTTHEISEIPEDATYGDWLGAIGVPAELVAALAA